MDMIKIIKPGLFTTIQDSGRIGFQRYGIPVAGAMDDFAFRIANILVGNDEHEAVLEATFMGPTIEIGFDGFIAITGANMSPKLNGNDILMWRSVEVHKGDRLTLSGASEGVRSYIAFGGGLAVPEIMKSKSTYVRGSLGGYKGRKLMEGDEIPVDVSKSKTKTPRGISPVYIPRYSKKNVVRVVLGPQDDHFTTEAIDTFLNSEYKITAEADRMGYRLDGPKLTHAKGPDIISDGIVFGSIQIPGHGSPIVMMADRQTTGGYTKIATVIWTDLSILAQMGPGDTVRFQKVSVEESQDILAEYEKNISDIKNRVEHSYIVQIEDKVYNITIRKI